MVHHHPHEGWRRHETMTFGQNPVASHYITHGYMPATRDVPEMLLTKNYGPRRGLVTPEAALALAIFAKQGLCLKALTPSRAIKSRENPHGIPALGPFGAEGFGDRAGRQYVRALR